MRFDKVEIKVRTPWTGDMGSTRNASIDDMSMSRSQVYTKFNENLFKAFKDQHKYTLIGLSILSRVSRSSCHLSIFE
jgi:hypothetical protein